MKLSVERGRRVVGAVGVDVQADLEALGVVARRLGVGQRRVGIDVRGAADALPVGHRAARPGWRRVYWSKRPAVPPLAWSSPVMTTAAFTPRGKYQKRGSGFLSAVHRADQVGEQALLLVGLRDGHLVRGRPSRAGRRPLRAEEQVVGADRRRCRRAPGRPRPGCPGACRRRPRQVVGERRRLPAVGADARAASRPGWRWRCVASE